MCRTCRCRATVALNMGLNGEGVRCGPTAGRRCLYCYGQPLLVAVVVVVVCGVGSDGSVDDFVVTVVCR